jgi:16S rRNA (guanine527-N7)-methyltransferase
LRITGEQRRAFDVYRDLLITESARYNLTALRDSEKIEQRHFGESLALLDAIERAGGFGSPAIDVGTGAGFPGVPLKIARPELQLTLLEATAKKAAFLEKLVSALGLDGVTIVNARAEELGHDPAHRGQYALVLARAVAPLRVLVELTLPFLQQGGCLAAVKGSGAAREVREAAHALEVLGGEPSQPVKLEAPGATVPPTLVLVRRMGATPDSYPRRPGIPSKRPL